MDNTNTKRLRIAIQKKGKLSEECLSIFSKCGLSTTIGSRQLIYKVPEMPIDLLLCRDDDIPSFINENACDAGIVGKNVYEEFLFDNPTSIDNLYMEEKLGFSKCRLSIATPKEFNYTGLQSLQNKVIATTYPRILTSYLEHNNITAEIFRIEGSVEAAPSLNLSDVICDIVSTGSTLQALGLVEQDTILNSEALLIANNHLKEDSEKYAILTSIKQRIDSVIRAKYSKYIMLNCHKHNLDNITNLLPGVGSPTVMDLKNQDQVAVHSLCTEPIFWETMEQLKKAGASSILVLPVEKMLD